MQSVLEDIWLAREEKRRRGLESLDYRNLLAINVRSSQHFNFFFFFFSPHHKILFEGSADSLCNQSGTDEQFISNGDKSLQANVSVGVRSVSRHLDHKRHSCPCFIFFIFYQRFTAGTVDCFFFFFFKKRTQQLSAR